MHCFKCHRPSLKFFCKDCERILSDFTLNTRIIGDDFKVFYFYPYSEIKDLFINKHQFYGSFMFDRLAHFSFKKFALNFEFDKKIDAIPLDDRINKCGYSHTAILANKLRSKILSPKFNVILDRSNYKYHGKNLEYRQTHKKEFFILNKPKNPIILVDDIITSGISLSLAKNVCEEAGIFVLFGLVLANAKE